MIYEDETIVKQLDKDLRFDGLSVAEKITNQSYKEDANTALMGLALSMENNKSKTSMLSACGDSTLSMDMEPYRQVIREEGFTLALHLPFQGEKQTQEEFEVWFHTDGLLLVMDSFEGCRNSAKVYYNWKPNPDIQYHKYTSSGSISRVDQTVWIGDHDAREAIRFKLFNLRKHGTFLSQWIENPFLWLLHHRDTKQAGYDYKKINSERLAMLPDQVRIAINGDSK